jgi:hypothetical protein
MNLCDTKKPTHKGKNYLKILHMPGSIRGIRANCKEYFVRFIFLHARMHERMQPEPFSSRQKHRLMGLRGVFFCLTGLSHSGALGAHAVVGIDWTTKLSPFKPTNLAQKLGDFPT